MTKTIIAFVLFTVACADNTTTITVDQYVDCKDYCGEDGVRDFIKGDNGYTCICNITRKV
jgi:hypothetical protein